MHYANGHIVCTLLKADHSVCPICNQPHIHIPQFQRLMWRRFPSSFESAFIEAFVKALVHWFEATGRTSEVSTRVPVLNSSSPLIKKHTWNLLSVLVLADTFPLNRWCWSISYCWNQCSPIKNLLGGVLMDFKDIITFMHTICDWILENHSKLHIRSFRIDGFKDLSQGKQACLWNLHKECINLSSFRQPQALLAAFI